MRGLIWLTWRQHRWPIAVSAAITAILVVLMLMTAADLGSMAAKCLTAASTAEVRAGARPRPCRRTPPT